MPHGPTFSISALLVLEPPHGLMLFQQSKRNQIQHPQELVRRQSIRKRYGFIIADYDSLQKGTSNESFRTEAWANASIPKSPTQAQNAQRHVNR
jgi:hypothetical protein